MESTSLNQDILLKIFKGERVSGAFPDDNGDGTSNKIELDRLHSVWTAEFNYKRPGARCADSKTVSCTITGSNFRQFFHTIFHALSDHLRALIECMQELILLHQALMFQSGSVSPCKSLLNTNRVTCRCRSALEIIKLIRATKVSQVNHVIKQLRSLQVAPGVELMVDRGDK